MHCAWNSRIWHFYLNNTLLLQRNLWNLVFATLRPESEIDFNNFVDFQQARWYPHVDKDSHTQNYTQSHIHTHTIVLHTHTAHTHEDMFRHTHTRVTQYIEKGGTRQELSELRVTDKSVVESRVSESLFIYMYFGLYDGGSNSWWSPKWIMGHEPSGN